MKNQWIGAFVGLLASAGIGLAQPAGVGGVLPDAPPPAVSSSGNNPLVAGSSSTCTPANSSPAFCNESSRAWFSADYLLWWVRKGSLPRPLVVTGPETDAFPGALDQPNTASLLGGNGLRDNVFSGLRLEGGMWLDAEQSLGIEGSAFYLEKRTVGFSAAGDANGQPFIARPFINAISGNENVYFVSQNFADPNLSAAMTGGINITSSTRLWGWETNAVANLYREGSLHIDAIAGFRLLSLREDLRISEVLSNVVPGGGTSFLGTIIDLPGSVSSFDLFQTDNRFYGGQVGGKIDWSNGRFSVGLRAKVALGVSQEIVNIDGNTGLFNAGTLVTTAPGGVLTQTTNMGRHLQNEFAVVPEVGLNLGVQLTSRLSARVGYTFLYWSSVARPGNQIDSAINPNLVPTDLGFGTPGGPSRPSPLFRTTDFWAQGINLGMEFRY
ncbi:MAG: BBP7 family outer membrane beta-barrel protein [Gemmataceae bacterium]